MTGQRFFGSPYGIDEASARSALDLTSPDSREVVLAPAEWDEADAHALDAAVAWLDGYFAGEAPSPASVPELPPVSWTTKLKSKKQEAFHVYKSGSKT